MLARNKKEFIELFNTIEDPREDGLDFIEEINKEHGRIEVRRCWSTSNIDWLKKDILIGLHSKVYVI